MLLYINEYIEKKQIQIEKNDIYIYKIIYLPYIPNYFYNVETSSCSHSKTLTGEENNNYSNEFHESKQLFMDKGEYASDHFIHNEDEKNEKMKNYSLKNYIGDIINSQSNNHVQHNNHIINSLHNFYYSKGEYNNMPQCLHKSKK